MKSALLAIALLSATSCTIHPFATDGRAMVSLGGSIFSKSAGSSAYYKGPLGELGYSESSRDETVVPAKALNTWATGKAIDGVTSALRVTEGTKRVLSGHEVSKEATRSAADVEKLKILNPVEVPVGNVP